MSKAQISKIIHSGGFLGALLSKLEVPLEVAVHELKKKKKNIDLKLQLTNSNEIMNGVIKFFKLLKILIFYCKELLKQLKMKQKHKKEDF